MLATYTKISTCQGQLTPPPEHLWFCGKQNDPHLFAAASVAWVFSTGAALTAAARRAVTAKRIEESCILKR